jgi:hypothetical protein
VIEQETRYFEPHLDRTVRLRSKEDEVDYRYRRQPPPPPSCAVLHLRLCVVCVLSSPPLCVSPLCVAVCVCVCVLWGATGVGRPVNAWVGGWGPQGIFRNRTFRRW